MLHRPALLTVILLCCTLLIGAQTPEVQVLTSGTKTSLRGLSVVNDNVVWVSGSNGTVGRSNNGGKNWNWFTVKGFEKTEFRDIEAFDASTAIIIAIAEPAYILKTTDGGETWKTVYQNNTKGMFLDAMDFVGEKYGMVVGDPINGHIFLAETWDGGDSWKEYNAKLPADSGEAFFAASGTNICLFKDKYFMLASGGMRSRLITKDKTIDLPIIQGKESAGANSLDVYVQPNLNRSGRMIVVGGDFANDTATTGNCFYSNNGGKTWKAPDVPPHGYRSCVEFLSQKDLLTCGLNGVDYSPNGGRTWNWISKESFNVCRIAKLGTAIYLAGNNGKIARITWR
ncbi:MAG: oxidoreductase [Chitinophagaceae bacterium]|nr:oxidoreductase [Chitinophagaceae bacterium]